jgi:hypothetical protein
MKSTWYTTVGVAGLLLGVIYLITQTDNPTTAQATTGVVYLASVTFGLWKIVSLGSKLLLLASMPNKWVSGIATGLFITFMALTKIASFGMPTPDINWDRAAAWKVIFILSWAAMDAWHFFEARKKKR